ncbi:hypothetical protein GIB67_043140 [Kingdonia uniflora]|uniref:Pentatricopeptide repeat-containing protein n=1 Tax=Kingdonia uniflora TaxID=39325 RepID=A0A7J7NJ82_9MAGN|nr:hypothetical protein GIB67_043140 [Kingdonia uniflora]
MKQLKQIQTHMFTLGLTQNKETLNKFMAFCTNPDSGNLNYAERVFSSIQNPCLFVYNLMIKALTKEGSLRKVVLLFNELREEGLSPDSFTYPFVLKAIGRLRGGSEGINIHGFIVKTGVEFDSYVGNALLGLYSKCGCLSYARQVFNQMRVKDVVTFTNMVSGYVNYGKLNEARELFERSPVKDVVLWTTMINGYVQSNYFEEALTLFQEMQVCRVKPDKFTIVALLTGCAQMGALEQGSWIHGYIENNYIMIDTVVGTALIEMYAKCGCVDKSLEIFMGVKEKDTALWTAIICGLAMNGQTKKSLELFSNMQQDGGEPDAITFIGILSACSHGGFVEEGRQYFDSMKNVYKIEPKVEHYGCLVDLLGRSGLLDEAETMIEKIPNIVADGNMDLLPLWSSLLGACRTHNNVEKGVHVSEKISELEFSNSGVRTLVSNIYAASNRWEDVNKVRTTMKDLRMKKIPGFSSIETNAIVH